MIANLHTLDTARRYCDRVIGMRDGKIVFDGTPDLLATNVARDIYGGGTSFSEAATLTNLDRLEGSSMASSGSFLAILGKLSNEISNPTPAKCST